MQEVYQNCEIHPNCLYQNINIARDCAELRIQCAQCIYEVNGNRFKNQDYIMFKTIKEQPVQYLQRTSQSPDLLHFLEIKQLVQIQSQEYLNLFEQSFNIYVNKIRQKLRFCKKQLETIAKNQNDVLDDILNECQVKEVVDSIEEMVYLQGEELSKKIFTLNQITTDLVLQDDYKQKIANKVQEFLQNQRQNIDLQAKEYQKIQVLYNQLQDTLKLIVEDQSLFKLWDKQIYKKRNQQNQIDEQEEQKSQQEEQQQEEQQQQSEQEDSQQEQQDKNQQQQSSIWLTASQIGQNGYKSS